MKKNTANKEILKQHFNIHISELVPSYLYVMPWSPNNSEGKTCFKRSLKINTFRYFSYAMMGNVCFRAASWAEILQ